MLHKQIRVLKDASLGARQIRIVASDGTPDRMGDVMVPSGCDFAEYRTNPIVLAQHDPDSPIGNAQIKCRNSRIEALIDFAPDGISKKADEYCGLYKTGVMNAASVGFDPVEREPITGGGWRYTNWKLLELSLVSVPANPNAVLIERRMPAGYVRSERERIEDFAAMKSLTFHITDFPDAYDAWLRCEYPGLKSSDARCDAHTQHMGCVGRDHRRKTRAAQFDFTLKYLKRSPDPSAMSEEDHAAHRRRVLAEMEANAPARSIVQDSQLANNWFYMRDFR